MPESVFSDLNGGAATALLSEQNQYKHNLVQNQSNRAFQFVSVGIEQN